MANRLYSKEQIGLYLRYFRENSHVPDYQKQSALGRALGISQKRMSHIENCLCAPDLEIVLRWCTLTGWHEGREMALYMYDVTPMALPPITPELNQRYIDSLINLKEQLMHAMESVDASIENYNSRRPGQAFSFINLMPEKKEIVDLIPAVKTVLYSAEREFGFDIPEVMRTWIQESLADGLTMPRLDELIRRTKGAVTA